MIPKSLKCQIDNSGLSSPASYGLIEGWESQRTDIDGDADAEYFEDCAEMFPGDYGAILETPND